MADATTPEMRYLAAMAGEDVAIPETPMTPQSVYYAKIIARLDDIAAGGGGGSGGTTNYDALRNRPSINGVTLTGDMSSADLGIVIPTKTSDLTDDVGYARAADMTEALASKRDHLKETDGFYPIMDLDTIPGLTVFFVMVGLTLGLAYTDENPFVYFQF